VPISAGMALAPQLSLSENIAVVFIGDGTFGEGVVYETFNIASKWKLPLLIICENNYYAQSTATFDHLSGSIELRASAFGIEYRQGDTEYYEKLLIDAKNSIDYVRCNRVPLLFEVKTYRLSAHSKGDDDRDPSEIQSFWQRDPIKKFLVDHTTEYQKIYEHVSREIDIVVQECKKLGELSLNDYILFKPPSNLCSDWLPITSINKRQVQAINEFFVEELGRNPKALFIGEDVLSPYGGAFKVAKNLSLLYPKQVFSTPISELAICGIANGLALRGFKPYVEIMFGDFITLALDQIINHASKFKHMYNNQVECPIVIRTPMGGGRGYGPTHSQTLDRLLMGIPNVDLVALNAFIDPAAIYSTVSKSKSPVIVVENKSDYGKQIGFERLRGFLYHQATFEGYPIIRITPEKLPADYTIVTYGGMADTVHQALREAFIEFESVGEIFVFTRISPLDLSCVANSVIKTGRLVVVEEGVGCAGFGSEVISQCKEILNNKPFRSERVFSLNVPIPSIKSLEKLVLPSVSRVLESIKKLL